MGWELAKKGGRGVKKKKKRKERGGVGGGGGVQVYDNSPTDALVENSFEIAKQGDMPGIWGNENKLASYRG